MKQTSAIHSVDTGLFYAAFFVIFQAIQNIVFQSSAPGLLKLFLFCDPSLKKGVSMRPRGWIG